MGFAKLLISAFLYTIGGLLCFLAIIGVQVYNNHWYHSKQLLAKDYQAANFNVIREIPTTFYRASHLGDVLQEWDPTFHLYRVEDPQNYNFDIDILNTSLVARKLDSSCLDDLKVNQCKKRSTLNVNCMFDKHEGQMVEDVIDARDIFKDSGKGYYASFAKILNHDVVANLWSLLHLPFSVDTTQFEHAFFSNLERSEVTASFHANAMTLSMSIQFVGRKTWLFMPASTYRDSMRSTFAGSTLLIKNSPPVGHPADLFVYTSEPGDVLFFPESWGHAVYTYAGPSVMVNYRKMTVGNFLRQPVSYVTGLFNTVFLKKLTNDNKIKDTMKANQKVLAVPSNNLNMYVMDQFDAMCEREGLTGLDKQMLDLIAAEATKYE